MKVGDGLSDEARSCTVHGTKGYLTWKEKISPCKQGER